MVENRTIKELEGQVSVREVLEYLRTDYYLDKKAAASYLSLSARTIEERLHEIPHYLVGRKLLFKRSQLDAWVESHGRSKQNLHEIADEVFRSVTGGQK